MDHVLNDSKHDIDRNYRFIQKAQKDEENDLCYKNVEGAW